MKVILELDLTAHESHKATLEQFELPHDDVVGTLADFLKGNHLVHFWVHGILCQIAEVKEVAQ
jgi:hypothetical protein